MSIEGQITINEVNIYEVTTSTYLTSGSLNAPIGSIAIIQSSSAELWIKSGSLATDWFRLDSIGGGNGVVPPFIFTASGTTTTGGYLKVGDVVSSNTGYPIKGSNYLVELQVTLRSAVVSTTRIQLQRRTGESTFTDITNAYIDIPAGQYKSVRDDISIPIGPDWEISAYNQSGSNINNPVLVLYMTPN